MSSPDEIEILDVTDASSFALLPPCALARFDHRSCDYWEDAVRGSKSARSSWWQVGSPTPEPKPPPPDNPFAPRPSGAPEPNPFTPTAAEALFNPFAPASRQAHDVEDARVPRKLRLLLRGRAVFGSYAKVLRLGGEPAAYVQFGPLSAYPRAQHIRELYPALPSAPLPAVITCVSTTPAARGRGLGQRLVEAVVEDLATRGFAAVEAYPDLTLGPDEASAASPAFWLACGFELAVSDDRYPVLRRELD